MRGQRDAVRESELPHHDTDASNACNMQAAARFQRELDACFRRAARNAPRIKTLELGSRRIELHFASDILCDCLSPALACLQDGSGASPADVAIAIWDSESGAVSPPDSPWAPEHIGPRGEVIGFGAPRFRAAYNLDSKTLSFGDSASARCHFWMRSVSDLPAYERAAPLRTLLAWAVEGWASQLVHAACVAYGGRGALLAGKGGSGKSTCALSCLGTALDYVADDYCVLSLAQGRPEAFGVYATGKLERQHLALRLPHLSALASPQGAEDKAILHLGAASLRALRGPIRLEALVLPEVARDGRTELAPCSAASALTALAPSSLFQIPGLGRSTFRFLAEVVRRLPCYSLRVGSDLGNVQHTLRALLS